MVPSDEEHELSDDENASANESEVTNAVSFIVSRGGDPSSMTEFVGVALDTCCSLYFTVSKVQYLAYCAYTGQKPSIKPARRKFRTTGGASHSIGTAEVYTPFGQLCLLLKIEVHIFDHPSTAPLLLSYAVMKEHRWDMIISENHLRSSTDHSVLVKYDDISGIPIYRWHPSLNGRNHVLPQLNVLYARAS